MRKIVKQDGIKKVFVFDDGSEEPFEKIKNLIREKPEKLEKKKKFFEKEDKEIDE